MTVPEVNFRAVIASMLFLAAMPCRLPAQLPAIPADSARLRADARFLCNIDPPRNSGNPRSLDRCAGYIAGQFAASGATPRFQPFTVDGREYRNVICSFGPENAPRIVIGAHYDVCGDQPGADDNASGVAGLCELARLLGQLKPELKYRIDLAAYSLEEPPYYDTEHMGSYVHASSLRNSSIAVKAMLSLEMIGYYSDAPGSQQFPYFFLKWLYPDRGNFILLVGRNNGLAGPVKRNMRETCRVPVYGFWSNVRLSDHISFWRSGYPAIMVTNSAFFRNQNYHQKSDTPETLDYKRMAEVVKGLYWALVNYQ